MNKTGMGGVLGRPATICDENGELLFYTQGDTVWNRKHLVMQNGDDLTSEIGRWPITSVIVPHPGDGQLYYIFTANKALNFVDLPEGLHYAVVDMSGDGGNGAVIERKINLIGKVPALLTVVLHADEKSFWVISHGWNDNKFYAFHINEAGVQPAVVTAIGPTYGEITEQMKASPDGTILGVVNSLSFDFYSFNASTGEIYNAQSLSAGIAHFEFSPNSDLLYASVYQEFGWRGVAQYDISSGQPDKIEKSVVHLGNDSQVYYEEMQLAYNGRIYCGKNGQIRDSLACIINPNIKGLGCRFTNAGLWLPIIGNMSYCPLAVQSYYRESPAVPAQRGCRNMPTELKITSLGYADSVTWYYGDGIEETFKNQEGRIIEHIYSANGQYNVKVKKYIGNITRELVSFVSIIERPHVSLIPDTVLCEGDTVLLDAGSDGIKYHWSTDDETRQIKVSSSATYYVIVDNGVCESSDTVNVQVWDYPSFSLGEDRVFCDVDSITLRIAPVTDYSYKWSTGDETSTIDVYETKNYSVKVSRGRCSRIDSVHIQFARIKNISIPDSTIVVQFNDGLTLNATGINIDMWNWNFGDGVEVKEQNPKVSHLYTKAGSYQGYLTSSNSFGCSEVSYFSVEVPVYIFVANIITANNDDLNDFLEIKYNGDDSFVLEIFDRWGKGVFKSNTIANKWGAQDESPGVYFYTLRIGELSHRGWVQVLK